MKKFTYTVNKDGNSITILNGDEPISDAVLIRRLTFDSYMVTQMSHYMPPKKYRNFRISLRLENETEEVKSMFEKVLDASRPLLNCEDIVCEGSLENIIEFIQMLQKVDPLPIEALQLISDYTKNEQNDCVAHLLNLYTELEDPENEIHYWRLIKSIPETSPYYPPANQRLYEQLIQVKIPNNENEKLALTKKKLQYAMRANLNEEAARHFARLCGENDINPKVKSISGNPDTFIQIAEIQRGLRKEIEELRTDEAKHNASGASKNGMRANQTSEKFGFFKSGNQELMNQTDDMRVDIKSAPSKSLHHSL